jgi:AcrR family transcriptional regulator
MDRRVQKTRQALQEAFSKLLVERGYDSITVQDIAEQANVGRTTFYAHYSSKEELFRDSHHHFSHQISSMMVSEEDVLTSESLEGMLIILEELMNNRTIYLMMKHGPAWPEISQGLHEQIASHLLESLQKTFAGNKSDVPLELLANYIAAAQFGLISWWVETRAPYTSEEIARAIHSMRHAIIQEAMENKSTPPIH